MVGKQSNGLLSPLNEWSPWKAVTNRCFVFLFCRSQGWSKVMDCMKHGFLLVCFGKLQQPEMSPLKCRTSLDRPDRMP